jgi:Protein of unknown function (DUF2867)
MRLPDRAHTSQPWSIHEIAAEFRLEDVWALPTPGLREEFPRLVQWLAESDDQARASASGLTRALWAIRRQIGGVLRWDSPSPAGPTLRDRLPADLTAAASGPAFRGLIPFTSLYLLENEWAAELANRTMHGILHLGWVRDAADGYTGQLAILVKPNGLLGAAYMAAIKPFRRLIIYPQWTRQIGQAWRDMHQDQGSGRPPGRPQ